jgi:hypothetical protein
VNDAAAVLARGCALSARLDGPARDRMKRVPLAEQSIRYCRQWERQSAQPGCDSQAEAVGEEAPTRDAVLQRRRKPDYAG